MFEHGQIVRIDYGIREYWIEMLICSRTAKKYTTAVHRKSHRKVECSEEWKIDSLEAYAKVVDDLNLPRCRVPT